MSEETKRRLAAIVSADVVGYSRLMGRDEAGTLQRLRVHRSEHIDPLIAEHGGRIVKTMGDGLLLEFPSVVEATQCMIEIQSGMAKRNQGIDADQQITFRVGVNLGDIIIDGDDILGDGVNIAARLQEIADPGGLVISGRVYDDVRDRLEAGFADGGERKLKNIARPIQSWRWAEDTQAEKIKAKIGAAATDSYKPSIAVLPFANISGDAEQEYFADGISEDLITALSKFSWLFVTARNSSFAFKGVSADLRSVASELGVRYLLEGSIRKVGNRVRITAQLIDGSSGNHIWAEKFDRNLGDIFDLQDEITARIAAAIEPRLFEAEGARAALKSPENMDAWDLSLQARSAENLGTKDGNSKAVEIAKQALRLDSDSVQSLKVLASSLYHQVISGWADHRKQIFVEALEAAERATTISPNDADARQLLGLIYLGFSRYDEALAETKAALEINPDFAQGLVSLGICHNYLGEPERAIPLFEKAISISPRDLNMTTWRCTKALGQLLAGNFQEAIEDSKFSALRKDYWAPSRWYWAASAALAEDSEEADRARAEVLRLNPNFSIRRLRSAHPFKRNEDFELLADGLRKAGLPE
jgi:adenylate cyclase